MLFWVLCFDLLCAHYSSHSSPVISEASSAQLPFDSASPNDALFAEQCKIAADALADSPATSEAVMIGSSLNTKQHCVFPFSSGVGGGRKTLKASRLAVALDLSVGRLWYLEVFGQFEQARGTVSVGKPTTTT